MNRNLSTDYGSHLTEEQMDLLVSQPDRSEDAQTASLRAFAISHLRGCAACRQQVSTMRDVLLAFRGATTAFAAAHEPKRVPNTYQVRHKPRASSGLVPRLAFAGAFASIALAVGFWPSLALKLHPAKNGAVILPVEQAAMTSPEADAALMQGIDQDLSTSIPPSFAPLQVSVATSSSH